MTTPIDKLQATQDEIMAAVRRQHPEITSVLGRVTAKVPFIKRQVAEYQGALLYALAAQYNREGAMILEIGTAWGYSAACMATAASKAELITLNPKQTEYPAAIKHLAYWPNVTVANRKSWDYVDQNDHMFDMVFVDGDHGQVRRDLIWWRFLKGGGLLLFHDYSPDGSGRPCQPVYDEVNRFAKQLGRPLDVLIVDERGVGLAGFYKDGRGTGGIRCCV